MKKFMSYQPTIIHEEFTTSMLNKGKTTPTQNFPKYGTKEYMEEFFKGLEEISKTGQEYERVNVR